MRSQCSILVLLLISCCAISSTMAADCISNTQNLIKTSDIQALSNDIASNNFNPPIEDPSGLPALTSETFNRGTTIFCLRNKFVFEDTHVALGDIAFGANDIISQCCSGPDCQGGSFTVTGDNKITTILTVQPGGTTC